MSASSPSRRHSLRALALGGAALGTWPGRAFAQAAPYPSQPLRIIVPQPPGGGFDTVARILAEPLGNALGQPVLVENRPGSGTLVGTEAVAKAAPDGYTLLLGGLSNIAINPGLYPKLSYDPLRDFKPVGLAVAYAYTLIARKDLPVQSLEDLIRQARDKPGAFTYASAGNGSGQHVASAVLFQQARVRLVHVPYRGAQQAYQDLLGGRVDLLFDLSPTAKVQIDAQRVKPLAVSSLERLDYHPQVPTVTETGVAQLDMQSWFGLFAPAAVPAPVLERLRSELGKVAALPEVVDKFRRNGGQPLRLSAAQAETLVRNDVARWTRLVREAGVTPE